MDEDIKAPKISVLLPVYNGGEYLQTAIDSILNQTFSDFEFIIINDASTDDSEKVILSNTDSRIVYIKNEQNLGLIKTLNKGLDLCKGEYIARMDQDDIANPTRFEKQNTVLDHNLEIGVCGTWFTFFGTRENTVVKHPEYHEQIKIAMLGNCPIGHPTVMLRKNNVGNLRYDVNYQAAEDYEFWSRLVRITQFYNIQESLLQYRIHNSNMSILENSTQINNAKKITGNQLKIIGIENTDFNIEQCQILLGAIFKFRLSDDEFRKLVIFANELESKNQQTKFYDKEELHKIVHIQLLEALRKTVNKRLSTISFLLKYRKEIITKRNMTANIKMLARMILKK